LMNSLLFLWYTQDSTNSDTDQYTKHGLFLEGVYEIELDTKTEYEGF
jgi:hypothetical protein